MTRSPKLKLFATSLAVGVVKFALTVTCAGAAEQAQFIPVNFPHCSEMPDAPDCKSSAPQMRTAPKRAQHPFKKNS